MGELNSVIIRKAYEDFAHANIPAVFAAFDADITWHVPGHSPLSGDYTGSDQIGSFFNARIWRVLWPSFRGRFRHRRRGKQIGCRTWSNLLFTAEIRLSIILLCGVRKRLPVAAHGWRSWTPHKFEHHIPHPALGQELALSRATPSAVSDHLSELIGFPISKVLPYVLRLS